MSKTITLRVITDQGLAIQDEAVSIVAPGTVGYLGILHNHAPLVTTLAPGRLRWRTPAGRQQVRLISEGLLEIQCNRCTVLTRNVSEQAASAKDSRDVL